MRRYVILSLLPLLCLTAFAQSGQPFKRTIYNNEYNIYLTMNFYDRDITLAGQEFMGEMDGYIGDDDNFRKWLILDSKLTGDDAATLDIINLEGSEDLKATLTYNADGTYTLRQQSGSALKVVRGNKWVKLPKTITFTTTRNK
ncbi:MAG: cellulose biosynthesis protein BcsE [Prevotella sp.]|nr:cellulose biosynthesis protein BcsE [Prevotella sp.]